MASKTRLMIVVLLIWAALFAASFLLSMRIDGPRNLDTGFRRLDVLARYQMLALAVAVLAAIAGIAWRKTGRRVMLIGLVPLLTTGLLVAALVIATLVFNPSGPAEPAEPRAPLRPTAPAQEVQD